MGYACGELPDGGQFLRLDQVRLQVAFFGHILLDDDRLGCQVPLIENRKSTNLPFDESLLAQPGPAQADIVLTRRKGFAGSTARAGTGAQVQLLITLVAD